MGEQNQPVEHLSLRVPWHDAGWNGHVCADPLGNGTCLLLKNIGENRRDDLEAKLAGTHIADLAPADAPPCLNERATFLSDRALTLVRRHPFAHNPAFAVFRPTRQTLPPFSAHAIPFRWMSRGGADEVGAERRLAYRPDLEELVDSITGWHKSSWVMHGDNQRDLLDTFFETIRPESSLVFFYAKHSPLSDDPRRLLVGAAEVAKVTPSGEYDTASNAAFAAQMWETTVEHTLRRDQRRGFLMPYQQLLAERDATGVEIDDALAFAPEAGWVAFSYVTEHVSHDLAVDALLSLSAAGQQAQRILGDKAGPLGFEWLEAQLNRLWQLRGPCPGLASALAALGVTQPVTFAHMIEAAAGPGADPWPVVDRAMHAPEQVGLTAAGYLTSTVRTTWQRLRPQRSALLELLSRFALTRDQAARFFVAEERLSDLADEEILANPYVVFESDRYEPDAVPFTVVDRGCYPVNAAAVAHPLPRPSAMADALDPRRVRALLVDHLHRAQFVGHTLLPQDDLVNAIRERKLSIACPVTGDVLDAHELSAGTLPADGPLAAARLGGGGPALQLTELARYGRLIREQVERRIAAAAIGEVPDFAAELDAELDAHSDAGPRDDTEARSVELLARKEKVAALEVLYASRISVLIGSAGTGKTTLLKVFRHTPGVASGGVLLLAPTGKARVQLAQRVHPDAVTVAQFLIRTERFDPESERYVVTGDPQTRVKAYKTVIVDEASMLTEEQLAALLDAVTGYHRLILVGDPQQLPPIGAGRPFVDIVRRLRPDDIDRRNPRCGPGYAELTIPRRQAGHDRDDLTLASWFADGPIAPAADDVWDRLRRGEPMPTVRAVPYLPTKLFPTLLEVLRSEIPEMADVSDADLANAFAHSYGGEVSPRGTLYFPSRASERVDAWQILSPVRGRAWGTAELNRALKDRFRAAALDHSTGKMRSYAPPIGPERIVVGDKVINIRNYQFPERRIWPKEAESFVANGELGLVVGQAKSRVVTWTPNKTEIEFGGRPAKYTYYDWSDDTRAPMLELAWAITIHKAQGSEFGLTVVVLPATGAGLSRELLYTALTRQKKRVILLHAGSLDDLARQGTPAYSDTTKRLTNLFDDPQPVGFGEVTIDGRLVHRTTRGELVRSKSEVIIANILHDLGADYEYEQPYTGKDGRVVRPDFTITTEFGGEVLWEHLGMLADPRYAAKWAAKEQWYRDNGVLRVSDATAGPTRLLVTDERDGADSSAWRQLARMALDQ